MSELAKMSSAQSRFIDVMADHGAVPFVRSVTFPPEFYTSETVYRIEVERVLRSGWNCVGHVSQLRKDGDYFTYDLLGDMLVVTRSQGRIRVLSRVCTHRWMPVVHGAGNAGSFTCPLHSWKFGLDGSFLGAPLMDDRGLDPAACSLRAFRSETVEGFIFVTFSDATPSLAGTVADLTARLAPHRLDRLELAGTLRYDCGINWKIVVETFMECYHHIAAHSETFEKTYPARLSYVEDVGPAWSLCGAKIRPEMPTSANLLGLPEMPAVSEAERREFRLYSIFPTHLLNVFPDRVYWFTVQPLGPTRSIMTTHLLVQPEALADPTCRPIIEAELRFMDVANKEDIAVNEMQQRGAATPTARPGRLSHLEKSVWHLANYVRERLGGTPPRPADGGFGGRR